MKKAIAFLSIALFSVSLVTTAFSQKKFNIQGKKILAKDICGECNPGNYGPYLPLYKKSYEPQLEDNSTPLDIAYQLLGHVYPETDLSGTINAACNPKGAQSPFPIEAVKKLGGTGTGGTSINYSKKELLKLDIGATVEADLKSIKALQPALDAVKLTAFGAKLTAAYSKFANKEILISGKYYQYALDKNVVENLAKNAAYQDCRAYLDKKEKRMITAVGLVYFDVSSSENSLDEIATSLEADATYYGITFGIKFNFKKTISKNLKNTTEGYYQVLVIRSVGKEELDILN